MQDVSGYFDSNPPDWSLTSFGRKAASKDSAGASSASGPVPRLQLASVGIIPGKPAAFPL